MTGFEPGPSWIGSDVTVTCATTIAQALNDFKSGRVSQTMDNFAVSVSLTQRVYKVGHCLGKHSKSLLPLVASSSHYSRGLEFQSSGHVVAVSQNVIIRLNELCKTCFGVQCHLLGRSLTFTRESRNWRTKGSLSTILITISTSCTNWRQEKIKGKMRNKIYVKS